jgi:2,3-bisphosphoglycerate-independent phosphoglycerate mutase
MIERILVLFLDGVGLGDDDPRVNPLARVHLPFLSSLLNEHRPLKANAGLTAKNASLKALDARLGIPGLPQSATGQATILTGINAPALLGQHDGPYPNRQLQDLLASGNLFVDVMAAGLATAFANAYSGKFLDRIQRHTQRMSANAHAALLAGLKLRGPGDLKIGHAVSSLLTNEYFQEWGYDVPDISVARAGSQLAKIAHEHVLTFFEFWYTDVIGHRQDQQLAGYVLQQLDKFIEGILNTLDTSRSTLVIISDHGNLEDLSSSKHTLNPALGLLVGAGHALVAARLATLIDVTPTLLGVLVDGRG